jgi:protein-disulfide isomerase/uncharacterized membrane protein
VGREENRAREGAQENARSGRFARACAALLVVVGFALSAYLLARTFVLLAAVAPGSVDVCSTVFGRGCDETLSADEPLFGLPLAGWGIVFFGMIGGALLLGQLVDRLREAAGAVAFVFAIFGAAASLVLAARFVLGYAPFCPLCTTVHAVCLALLVATWRGRPRPFPARGGILVSLGVGVAVGAGFYGWGHAQFARRATFDPGAVVARYLAEPRQEIPVTADDARLGRADARVRMVVFTSFQCPGCREFTRTLADLRRLFPERLDIVFKHYPLSPACNAAVRRDLHPRSCEAAWSAEAARRQGRFRIYHDLLFAAGPRLPDATLRAAAVRAGLDQARFLADRGDAATKAKVRADTALGTRLGVDATPAVFLGGRRVRDLRLTALTVLVVHLAGLDS